MDEDTVKTIVLVVLKDLRDLIMGIKRRSIPMSLALHGIRQVIKDLEK